MPNPFLPDADLRQALADAVGNGDPDTLDDKWSSIVAEANDWSYGVICDALSTRGYTAAQIAGWVRGRQVSIDLGLVRCAARGAGLANFNATGLQYLTKPDDLKTVQVIDSTGAVVVPGAPLAGTGVVVGGRLGGYESFDTRAAFRDRGLYYRRGY